MDFSKCISCYAEWDTTGASTGAPTFDFHLVSSMNGTDWITTVSHTSLAAAVLEAVRDGDTFSSTNIPHANVRAELDVNVANLAAGEYVILRLVLLNR